jgi:hypothetical protein
MRYLLTFSVLVSLVILNGLITLGNYGTDTTPAKPASAAFAETQRVYPIAPGVWYPGEPLPEKPMRYYRVRCFPGCHRGSSHGKYPSEPLEMKPIFPTSTIDLRPVTRTDAK